MVACQTPLSMEFSRQEHWNRYHSLPNPGIKSGSPPLQADSLPSEPPGKPHYTSKKKKAENVTELMLNTIIVL